MKELIFDPVRKKKVAFTPEEGVRQWLIKELSQKHGYPLHLMSCEYTLNIDKLAYRGDLVIFNNRMEPLMLAECKAPNVKITEKSFAQILRYNMALKVKYLIVTNGNNTYLAFLDTESGNHSFMKDIPDYNELS